MPTKVLNSCDKAYIPRQVRSIRPTRRSVSGFHVFRGVEQIPYESTLERDFIIRHEYSRHVLSIISQPAEIPFTTKQGQSYTYTPDFLVQYRLGNTHWEDALPPLLVEVKPWNELKQHWRKWSTKYKAARRFAKEQGYMFRIYDESRIRDQVLKNIQFLQRYKRMEFPESETRWIIDSLKEMGDAPFHYIHAKHFSSLDAAEGVSHIWHLLAIQKLECDMTVPLTQESTLWVTGNE